MRSKVIYDMLTQIFYEESMNSSSSRKQHVWIVVMGVQLLAQNINFMWNPYLDMDNWKTYINFWEVLNYPCIDSLAASYGLLNILMYFIIALIGASTNIIIIILLAYASNKKIPSILFKILRGCLKFTCELYFIPTSIILILLFKYSTVKIDEIQEYANLPNSEIMNFGVLGQAFSILILLIHIVLSILYEGCAFEIRHSLKEKNLSAKSSPSIEILIKIIYFINCIFFTNIQLSNYMTYMVILSMTYAYCTYKYIYYLPFYSAFMNYIKILIHFEAFCVSVFFVLGSFIGNSTIVFVLTVFMQPLIVFLSKFAIDYRMGIVSKPKKETESSLIVFELAIRKSLMSSENSKKLIKYINLHYENKKEKLLIVYLAYYCKDILENTNVAGIKISRVDYNGFDFITNFQIFKCQKILEMQNFQNSEGVKMCSYLLDSDGVMENEKKLCYTLLVIINNLIQGNIKISALEKLTISCNDILTTVKKNYEDLIEHFPESQESYKDYGTFLSKITFDIESGKRLINKYNCKSLNDRKNSKKLNVFSHHNSCVMISSANPLSFGKIMFANLNMCKFLNITSEDSKDYFFKLFIPIQIFDKLNWQMIKFIACSQSNYLFLNEYFFMTDINGFLLECYISTECLGYNSSVKFVSVVRSVNNSDRELGLLSDDNRIVNHTSGFTETMNMNFYKVDNIKLEDCIPSDVSDQLLNKKQIIYNTPFGRGEYGLVIKEVKIVSSVIKVLHILKNPIDIINLSHCIDEDIPYNISYEKDKNTYQEISQEEISIHDDSPKSPNISELNLKSEEDLISDSIENKSIFLPSIVNRTGIEGSSHHEKIKISLPTMQSVFFLRILKIITGIYVFFIQVLILLIILISFCGYISKELYLTIIRKAISDMHDLNFQLSGLAYYTMLLDLTVHFPMPIDNLLKSYSESITKIITMQDQLKNDYNLLAYCHESNIFYDKNVLVYSNFQADYNKDNLAGILENTISNVISNQARKYIITYQDIIENNHKELFYLLYNTFRISLQEFNIAIKGFLNCEIEKIKDKSIIIWYFNIISIIAIIFIAFIIIGLSGKNDRNIEKSWIRLRESVKKSQRTVKNSIYERLATHHNATERDNQDHNSEENLDAIKLKKKYQHILRLIILIAIPIGAMLFVSEVLYKQSQKTTILKNEVFHNLMTQSTKIWQFGFFTFEALADRESYGFSKYTNMTIYSNYIKAMNDTILEIKILQNIIDEISIEGNIPIELADLLYFKTNTYDDVRETGIFVGVLALFDDSQNFLYNSTSLSLKGLQNFAYNVESAAGGLRNASFLGSDLMKNEVFFLCIILGIFFTFIVFFLIGLSIALNFRYLACEGEVLESTESLRRIFTNAQRCL
ncbi:hypothetical protein SteCoe_2534 [Stentor coeruleus]|uniref:TmcB/TmcC TPR repeats domain-containing protein n=1 Tax=Stentor coeruleus TaxID=5963 RepID=A0A1R2CZC7_9CILI|nr:hypothetical protein SteCoe_2534 [Stentor coeruleus]